ncbi:MAG: hypothetical protein Q7R53_01140 [bacterium]|nr:hypothetical protein [bacterium]
MSLETGKKPNPLECQLGDVSRDIDWDLANVGKIIKRRLNEYLQPFSGHLPANIIVAERDMTKETGDNLVVSVEFNMRSGSLEEVATEYKLTGYGSSYIPRRIRTDPLPLSRYPDYAFLVMNRAVDLYNEVIQGKIEPGLAMTPQYPVGIATKLSTY